MISTKPVNDHAEDSGHDSGINNWCEDISVLKLLCLYINYDNEFPPSKVVLLYGPTFELVLLSSN